MEKYILLICYLALTLIMSIASFALFNKDKNIAKKGNGQMRIKEKTLLLSAVLNGAVGALVGRVVAHHKTDKVYFSITIYLALLCQVAVAAFILLLTLGVF